jgi:hypothetical protein
MKRQSHVLVLAALILLFSCKKYIQQQEEKAAIAVVTNGFWYVTKYLKNDTDITPSFSGYLFKFDQDGIVTGTLGSVATAGVWSVNIGAKTISTDFPTAVDPVKELNYTWTITDSYTDSVAARSLDTTSNTTNILQLRKQ